MPAKFILKCTAKRPQRFLKLSVTCTVIFVVAQANRATAQVSDVNQGGFTPKFSVIAPTSAIDFTSVTNSTKVTFQPNLRTQVGFDFNIGDSITLGASSVGPQTTEDRTKRGSTNYQDYRFTFTPKDRFLVNLNYSSFTGFYISNSADFDSTKVGTDQKTLYPDMKQTVYLGQGLYVFSPERFSLRSSLSQMSRQNQSGGSFLLGGTFTAVSFTNPTTIIPTQAQPNFDEDKLIKEGKFQNYSLDVGYGHTFVFGQKFYFTLLAIVGFGNQTAKYSDGTTESSNSSATQNSFAQVTLGYNGDRFLTGIGASTFNARFKTKAISVVQATSEFKYWIGYRF